MESPFKHLRAFVASLIATVAFATPAVSIAQTSSIVISAGAATSVGLATVAQYRVSSDALWADYKTVISIAVLNEINKMAASSGQPMTSSDYATIANLVKANLDASGPSTALFQRMDVAGRVRYGIDGLTSLAMHQPAGWMGDWGWSCAWEVLRFTCWGFDGGGGEIVEGIGRWNG